MNEQRRKPAVGGKDERSFRFDRAKVDEKARTVEVAFASETPVERWFGNEILVCDKAAVDLSRLNNGGAVLKDHDIRKQVGVVEKAWVDDDKVCRALLRYGKGEDAEEEFRDIVDGIRSLVSVSYEYGEKVVRLTADGKGETETWRIEQWTPLEISTVAIPADPNVGVGRSKETEEPAGNPATTEQRTMKPNIYLAPDGAPSGAGCATALTIDLAAERKKFLADERKRREEIAAINKAARNVPPEEQERALNDPELTPDRWAREVLTKWPDKGFNVKDTVLGVPQRDLSRYSFCRALSMLANNRPVDGLEGELSQELAKRMDITPAGFLVPLDVQMHERDHSFRVPVHMIGQRADLAAGAVATGGYVVATELRSTSFIELLRNRQICVAAGATILGGLQGNVDIPKQATAGAGAALAEAGAITNTDSTFGELALSPKRVGRGQAMSKQLLLQSSLDVENFVRMDLATTLAVLMDYYALHGSGSSNQPTGIASTSGIGSVALGTDGAAPTWASQVSLETEVGQDNADVGKLAYLTNAKGRGKLKQTAKVSGYPVFIWDTGMAPGEGMINGYRALVSNQVRSDLTKGSGTALTAEFFGNWADLILAYWGALDIVVDPYTLAKNAQVQITANAFFDVGVRHAESFAAIVDMVTT